MRPAHVKAADINELDPKSQYFRSHALPDQDIYLGISANETMKTLCTQAELGDIRKFYSSCKAFLIESVLQIQERFQFTDPVFYIIQCIDPHNASELVPKSLVNVMNALPQLSKFVDTEKLNVEWRSHYLIDELSRHMSCFDYWSIVFSKENAAGMKCFPNLKAVISSVLSLPFSNAAVERFFSKLNLTKTSQRNCLKNETICGLMHAVYHMKNKNTRSHTLEIDENLIKAAECEEQCHM